MLLFETYQFTDNPLEDPLKCGEGKFLVFPCAGPVPSDQLSTSTDSSLCYNYTSQIAINKLLPEEQLFVNVGHVQISVLLKIGQAEGRFREGTEFILSFLQGLSGKIYLQISFLKI